MSARGAMVVTAALVLGGCSGEALDLGGGAGRHVDVGVASGASVAEACAAPLGVTPMPFTTRDAVTRQIVGRWYACKPTSRSSVGGETSVGMELVADGLWFGLISTGAKQTVVRSQFSSDGWPYFVSALDSVTPRWQFSLLLGSERAAAASDPHLAYFLDDGRRLVLSTAGDDLVYVRIP